QAWAEFKGKLRAGQKDDPACWKTRLRCALNKSPEFSEVRDRSQLDISEPYKVYRLVPLSDSEGFGGITERSPGGRGFPGRRLRTPAAGLLDETPVPPADVSSSSTELLTVPHLSLSPLSVCQSGGWANRLTDEGILVNCALSPAAVNEIEVNFRIETSPHITALPSLLVSVLYGGEEVLRREVQSRDVRIAYSPSHCPSSPPSSLAPLAVSDTERISLPEPSAVEDPSRRSALMALLPYLERGIMLASTNGGIHVQRFCQGRVFWTGPTLHMENHAPRKLERTPNPVTLFDRQAFRQVMIVMTDEGGSPPQYKVTLCFGEELTDSDNCADKLITVQV
uniref:Interferon regulatory factor 9 n=1 Tax=Lepisosteus oculatus TaxID=7918 RepID=W5LYY0_LEPOC